MRFYQPPLSLTRRQFLTASLLGVASIDAAWAMDAPKKVRRSVRYCTVSPVRDDLIPLPDNSAADIPEVAWPAAMHAPAVTTPSLKSKAAKGQRSLLTIVNEDGTGVRRAWLPGLLHSGLFCGDRLIVVTRGEPGLLLVLDVETLAIVASVTAEDGWLMGGHVEPWLLPGQFAITMNRQIEGAYDRVDIYEIDPLRKIASFPSYGFQAHELKLDALTGRLYVGHYGSYYFSGPYRHLHSATPFERFMSPDESKLTYYPGSVSVVDAQSGRLISRLSSPGNGPHGHLAVSADGQVFLTRLPTLLASRSDTMTNPAFAQGTDHKQLKAEFYDQRRFDNTATSISIDHAANRFYLADRHPNGCLVHGSCQTPDQPTFVANPDPQRFGATMSLTLHPDGDHIIVACTDGILKFTRAGVLVPGGSFPAHVGPHSHICATS